METIKGVMITAVAVATLLFGIFGIAVGAILPAMAAWHFTKWMLGV